jgi:hypothetical protein
MEFGLIRRLRLQKSSFHKRQNMEAQMAHLIHKLKFTKVAVACSHDLTKILARDLMHFYHIVNIY